MKTKYIYVISAPRRHLVKIGIAFDPKKRLATLQIGSPVKLSLHYSSEVYGEVAASVIEAEVHRRLKNVSLHGEWFKMAPEVAKAAVVAVLHGEADSPLLAHLGRPPKPKKISCPHCSHAAVVRMTNKAIWHAAFRCQGCDRKITGRTIFPRIAAA
jgi:hypothetical protein